MTVFFSLNYSILQLWKLAPQADPDMHLSPTDLKILQPGTIAAIFLCREVNVTQLCACHTLSFMNNVRVKNS